MVKHVESADEFNALKKASKPVRVVSFLSFSLRMIILLVVVSFLLRATRVLEDKSVVLNVRYILKWI